MWWLVGWRLSYEAFRVGRSLRSSPFRFTGIYSGDSADDCDQPSRGVLVRLGEVRPATRSMGRRRSRAPYLYDTSELKYHWARRPTSDVEARAVRSTGRSSYVMRTVVSTAGSDRAPTAGAARATWTSPCRWAARLRTGLALLDQESRWRRRQLWPLLQNVAEVRWHRSFDNRACRTTLRETGRLTAADVYQPYFRRSPYEGLVFILSLLFTVNATHVSSLFEVGNRRIGAPWSADGGLMFLGSRSPPPLGRRRSPDGSTGGVAATGAEHIVLCRIVGCCAPAPVYRGFPIRLRFRGGSRRCGTATAGERLAAERRTEPGPVRTGRRAARGTGDVRAVAVALEGTARGARTT